MKKALVIILILAVALAPAVVFSHDALSAKELYINADTLLSDYIETYADLLEARDDNISKFESMRINRKNSFNLANSLASKEKNILQVDFNIENKYDSIKSREAQLEIEFRTSYLNLYTLQKSAEDEKSKALLKAKEFESGKKDNKSGYMSDNELLQLEYNTMSLNNSVLNKERKYESALRHFNYKIGSPLDYSEYQFDFDESILDLLDLNFYISNALENVSAIKLIQQKLDKYYIEQKHYDVYSFSTNLSYISDALRDLKINTRIQELQLEKTKTLLINSISTKYASLVIEKEKIALADLNIQRFLQEYNTIYSLYTRGYINFTELDESKDNLAEAKNDYVVLLYRYNTQVKSLENDCSYYPEESGS